MSTSRKPFVGGNWKMNLHGSEVAELANGLTALPLDASKVDVAVFPAFPYLAQVAAVLKSTPIKVGAQNFYSQANGAFTGEVSLSMLKDIGCEVVLVGHSERRHVLGETDEMINAKVLAALDAGFEVILCVGEKIEQREAGKTHQINMAQLEYGLAGVNADQMARITIAYEPVWAIGTGKTATPEDAQEAHDRIRRCLNFGFDWGEDIGNAVRIQYGGSMKPSNAVDLLSQTDIDGGLIGGASLKASDFMAIVHAAEQSQA